MNSTNNISAEYSPFQECAFRVDELFEHLKCFNASIVVSLGEDSTHVVSRVHYNSKTYKLVGFVLPCNDNGVLIHSWQHLSVLWKPLLKEVFLLNMHLFI